MTTEQLADFVPHDGFLKTNKSFPNKKKYLWINCDICGHRTNVYEYVNGLWLCKKHATIIKNEEQKVIAKLEGK